MEEPSAINKQEIIQCDNEHENLGCSSPCSQCDDDEIIRMVTFLIERPEQDSRCYRQNITIPLRAPPDVDMFETERKKKNLDEFPDFVVIGTNNSFPAGILLFTFCFFFFKD